MSSSSKCKRCNNFYLLGDKQILDDEDQEACVCMLGSQWKEVYRHDGFFNKPSANEGTSQIPISLRAANGGEMWTCLFCQNEANNSVSEFCDLCNLERGKNVEEMQRTEDRWICNTCTYSNHPSSSNCFACLSLHSEEIMNGNKSHMSEIPSSPLPTIPYGESSSSSLQEAHEVDKLCPICDNELNDDNGYLCGVDCFEHCKACLANWITDQVEIGKATSLKCLCGKHNLKYRQIRDLSSFISSECMEKYSRAQTVSQGLQCVIQKSEIACPGCNTITEIMQNQVSYNCYTKSCEFYTSSLCCKHNTHYKKPLVESYDGRWVLDLQGKAHCAKCMKDAGGSVSINEILISIQERFCDRCPACNCFVGDPADFDSCMCLKCYNCPQSFCAFCYDFASDWTSTHAHVRNCAMNPRENYFAKSESDWRQLMRERRVRIAEEIIGLSMLNNEEREFVRSKIILLL